MKKLVLTLPFLFLANLALASGFALYEFSARGNAMGGAVLAGDAEPASLALNPALIRTSRQTNSSRCNRCYCKWWCYLWWY